MDTFPIIVSVFKSIVYGLIDGLVQWLWDGFESIINELIDGPVNKTIASMAKLSF
jgi:hypothetical protein